jgi:hypothetical protein
MKQLQTRRQPSPPLSYLIIFDEKSPLPSAEGCISSMSHAPFVIRNGIYLLTTTTLCRLIDRAINRDASMSAHRL